MQADDAVLTEYLPDIGDDGGHVPRFVLPKGAEVSRGFAEIAFVKNHGAEPGAVENIRIFEVGIPVYGVPMTDDRHLAGRSGVGRIHHVLAGDVRARTVEDEGRPLPFCFICFDAVGKAICRFQRFDVIDVVAHRIYDHLKTLFRNQRRKGENCQQKQRRDHAPNQRTGSFASRARRCRAAKNSGTKVARTSSVEIKNRT